MREPRLRVPVIAVTAAGPGAPLALTELLSRPLRAGEVRVRVRAVGVNPVDWKMRAARGPLGIAQRLIGPRGPLIPGVDFAGEVVERAPDVTALAVGDRVVGGTNFARGQRGSYASEVIVRPDQCATLPDAVSFEDAACLPIAGVTARRALIEHGRIGTRPGQRVLVLGASGGVGLFAVQLARDLGAQVVGVCSARNAALVARLGATPVDYGRGDPLAAAKALGPFDLVLNTVGAEVYPIDACRALCAPAGAVTLVPVRPRDYPSLALRRARALLGRPDRAGLEPLVDAMARGALVAVIEARFPLADAEAAHARSREGRVVGKLVLTVP